MAKPMKSLELHYPMTQFLIMIVIFLMRVIDIQLVSNLDNTKKQFRQNNDKNQIKFLLEQGTLTIYTIHPGGNFWCKYAVLQLVQTQDAKITKFTGINWKTEKEKKKCID